MIVRPLRVGAVLGASAGLAHLGWVILVSLGWARPLLDFILRLHFLKIDVDVAPFDVATAVFLVVVTSSLGCFVGVVLAVIWNGMQPVPTKP